MIADRSDYLEGHSVAKEDASFDQNGNPLDSIVRFHNMLVAVLGRTYIYDHLMKFESVALLVYQNDGGQGLIYPGYPPADSPLHYSKFYERLYQIYDIRFGSRKDDEKFARKHWVLKDHDADAGYDPSTGFGWNVRISLAAVTPFTKDFGGRPQGRAVGCAETEAVHQNLSVG